MNRHKHNPQTEASDGGEHVISMLSAYIDGALDPADMQMVSQHLGACPACRSEYAELRATKQMLFSLPAVTPPRAFTLTDDMVGTGSRQSILSRLFKGGGRLYPVLAAGSAVAFVLLVVLTLADTSTGSPPVLANRSLATSSKPYYPTVATPVAGFEQAGPAVEGTAAPMTTTITGTLAAPSSSDQAGQELAEQPTGISSQSAQLQPFSSTQPALQIESGAPSPAVVLRVLLVMAGIALALGALAAKQRRL